MGPLKAAAAAKLMDVKYSAAFKVYTVRLQIRNYQALVLALMDEQTLTTALRDTNLCLHAPIKGSCA